MTTRGLPVSVLLRAISSVPHSNRIEANTAGNLSVFTRASRFVGYIDMTTGFYVTEAEATDSTAGRMSFQLTTHQIYARQKTVTRRIGWKSLKPGDIVTAVEQCQGLRKGERQVVMGRLRVIDVRRERLSKLITDEDYGRREVVLEGFPELTPLQFVRLFEDVNNIARHKVVTRIEFAYVD